MLCIFYNDDLANFWSPIFFYLFTFFSRTRQTYRQREREHMKRERDEVREGKKKHEQNSCLTLIVRCKFFIRV